MKMRLLEGMLLGAASASGQIEGGDVRHNWNDWADQGHIKDHTSPRRACDAFVRWREDIDLMHSMGLQIYRFSMEWARLEPEDGVYDQEALATYREMILYMKEKNIRPLLTLHHFTNPTWLEEKGGFEKPENTNYFLRYVEFAVRGVGDLVEEYITINEPNVYATQGYMGGGFPPGKNSIPKVIRVMSVMAACHVCAYERIHAIRRDMGFSDTKVGFAHHMRAFVPKSPRNPWHRLCRLLAEWMFQGMVTKACLRGQFRWPIGNVFGVQKGEYADFLALNYYTRSTVHSLADGMAEGVPVNDLGWEIYPEGLVECAQQMHAVLPRPIYVTENGTCDNQDRFRALYIMDHLRVMGESQLPFTRYYHWCFTDNFEWLEGESARFGLVHMDYETQQRTVKQSGQFYSQVIAAGGVTEEIFDQFVRGEEYHQ